MLSAAATAWQGIVVKCFLPGEVALTKPLVALDMKVIPNIGLALQRPLRYNRHWTVARAITMKQGMLLQQSHQWILTFHKIASVPLLIQKVSRP